MISPLEAKDLVVGCQSFALHLVLSKRLPAAIGRRRRHHGASALEIGDSNADSGIWMMC